MDAGPHITRLSLAAVPEHERLAVLNDVYGAALNMTFETLTDDPLEMDCDIHRLPGVAVIRTRNSPMVTHWRRPSDGHDGFALNWSPSRGAGSMRHLGREFSSDAGHALLTSGQDPADTVLQAGLDPVQIRIERGALLAMLPDAEARLMEPIAADAPALRLLASYAGLLPTLALDPALASAVALHIGDLVALALSTTRDAAALARERGVAAARLAAIKHWTIARLDRFELSVAAAAAAQGVTPRYVQKLFAAEGSSFSAFVLKRRLALAHRHIRDPRSAGRTISAIAFDAGFGDLSYFNRAFRAAYGATPSDVRHHARREAGSP